MWRSRAYTLIAATTTSQAWHHSEQVLHLLAVVRRPNASSYEQGCSSEAAHAIALSDIGHVLRSPSSDYRLAAPVYGGEV